MRAGDGGDGGDGGDDGVGGGEGGEGGDDGDDGGEAERAERREDSKMREAGSSEPGDCASTNRNSGPAHAWMRILNS